MSTKTTFKRVALVAVAALALGGLSAVSANAGTQIPSSVTVGTIPTIAKGQNALIPVTVALPTGTANNDSFTVVTKVTSAPTTSAFTGITKAGLKADGTAAGDSFVTGVIAAGSTTAAKLTYSVATSSTAVGYGGLGTPTQKSDFTPSVSSDFLVTNCTTSPSTAAAPCSMVVYINFQADVSGSYTFLVSATNAAVANTNAYAAGDASTSITVSTASAAATVTMTPVGNAPQANSANGQLIKVSIKDANGVAAALGGSDTIKIVPSSANTTLTVLKASDASTITSGSGTTGVTLGSTSFSNGTAYVQFKDSTATATTVVLTASGSGTLSSSVTHTASITTVVPTQATLTNVTIGDSATAVRPGSGHVGVASNADTAATTATSHTYTITDTGSSLTVGTSTESVDVNIVDTAGLYGVKAATVDLGVVTLTATTTTKYSGTVTISGALSTAATSFKVSVGNTASNTSGQYITVTSATPVYTSGSLVAGPATSIRGAVGGSITLTGAVTDQFGAAVANVPVTVSVAGRNATTVSVGLASDANGNVSYVLKDAALSTTTLTKDTVTLAITGASQSDGKNVVVVSYGTTTVSTVTVTGGNTTSSVANATVTVNPIYAGDGAESGAQPIKATVKDANGALLAGVPVTFTVAGTGVAVPTASATVYTGAAGTASSSVYAWIAGTYTYTVTAGGVSTTGTITFANTTSAYARTISAAVDGNVVTATVKDRFGNAVQGATVYIKLAGGANVGGLFKTSTTTGATGTAQFAVSGTGTATVYSNLDPSAVTGTLPSDQSCALAGNLTCASGATAAVAFTAATAGTALVSESGVGASIAPAGVNSASVSVTGNDKAAQSAADAATDAANEATDAANAATDAALAAADAADAATAAAQDASDAVASLASKVEAMVASLKAQITSLTNLVIKIQKKVKA
jgi:trimeric autotransporter adhesin